MYLTVPLVLYLLDPCVGLFVVPLVLHEITYCIFVYFNLLSLVLPLIVSSFTVPLV